MAVRFKNGHQRTRTYEDCGQHSRTLAITQDEIINKGKALAKYVYNAFKELEGDNTLGYIDAGDYRQYLAGFKAYFNYMNEQLKGHPHHPDLHAEEILAALKKEGLM